MFLRKSGIGAAVAAITAFAANPAAALPVEWGHGLPGAASPVMEQIESFHSLLLWIIVATCLFVLGLLVWIVIRYRATANPVPSKVHHNTLLEVAWTLIPVIILVFIAVPSFRLLYFQETLPKPDVQIKAIGKQWFWTYEYPGSAAGFTFDSLMLADADAAKAGKPRLLGVDNRHLCAGQQGDRDRNLRRRRDPFLRHARDGREDGRRAGPFQQDLVQAHQDRRLLWPVLGTVRFAPRLYADRAACRDRRRVCGLARHLRRKNSPRFENDATRVASK